MSFTAHLFFSGDCAEAFRRYAEIFGGDLQIMTLADLPDGAEMMPGAPPDTVVHAQLATDDGGVLAGADDPSGDGGPKLGIAINHVSATAEETERVFHALFDDGQVMMPLGETFFAPVFGAGTDRFGVQWMVMSAPSS